MRLGDICDKIGSGATPRGGKESYKDSGTPIIRSQNVLDWSFSSDGLAYLDDDQAFALSNVEVKPRDVLLNITGDSVARACIVPNEFTPARVNQHVSILRTNSSSNPFFLLAWLQMNKSLLLSLASSGATRKALTKTMLEKLDVNLPSIDVQDRIAGIVLSIQSKIEANSKLNGYLAELAQTLYNDWFRDFGHWGGRMPSHWESGVLGDYVSVKRGGSPRPIQEYLSNEGLRWLKIADVSGVNGPYISEIKEHIKEEGLRKTVHLEPGSLVLSNSATPGIPKILSIGTCIHDGWLYFPQSEFTNEWLYCYFLNVRQELVRMANGSVFQNLKTDIVKHFEIIRPDDETLDSFQKIIAPLFGLMEARQQESKQLAALRDALLPKLMSGEIDVSKIDLRQLNSHLTEH